LTAKPEITLGGLQLILDVSRVLVCGLFFYKMSSADCQMAGVCRFYLPFLYDGQTSVNNNFYQNTYMYVVIVSLA